MKEKKTEKKQGHSVMDTIREMEKEGYRYAGEGDSPYTQEFVDELHGRKERESSQ